MAAATPVQPAGGTIVQVVADGRPGGGTTAVLTLSRLLAERGLDVAVISQSGSFLVAEAQRLGLQAFGMDFSRRLDTPASARRLHAWFRLLQPAVVHAHGARAGLPVALASLPWRARPYRLAYTVHGFHYLAKPPGAFHLGRAAEAFCMRRADVTNFVSDGDRGIAQAQGLLARARSHRTIKNAVTVEPGLAGVPKRHDIGFLGRLTYQKNPLVLVDILLALRPLKPSLCVIGGGALEAELAARVAAAGLSDQVTITGEQGRADALRLAAGCRTLLLPSRWEGHPIALIEAMHLGLPVVASDVAGNNEIVIPGETGFLAPLEDAAAYAAHLGRLLGDPALAGRLSAQAREVVARDYSTSKMVGEHLALYGLAPRAGAAGGAA